jgi:hypothetical protein
MPRVGDKASLNLWCDLVVPAGADSFAELETFNGPGAVHAPGSAGTELSDEQSELDQPRSLLQ